MAARFGASFIGTFSLHFPSSQLVERRQANFDTAVRKCKEYTSIVWNEYLEILLDCWIIWKVADFPPSPPSHVTGGRPFWLVILATPHVGGATFGCHSGGGGHLGCPLAGFPQTQGNIVFCLVLVIYMTSRSCFWCHILLLTWHFFWCYSSHQVMAM